LQWKVFVAKSDPAPGWQRAIVALASTVIGVVAVGTLYWVQEVFIPLVFAVLLAFLLNPVVRSLQRRGLNRVPSVIAVVVLAGALIGGIGWLVTQQISGLLQELPEYTSNIKHKIRTVRGLGHGGKIERMIEDLADEMNPAPGKAEAPDDLHDNDSIPPPRRLANVVVEPQSPLWLTWLSRFLTPALTSVGGVAMAIVLVIFMLLGREDLRARFLRLMGQGRLSSTTRAIDEASQRISRFLLMQLMVNSIYGVIIAAGLYWVGIDYPVLWGFLAGSLRYVPYVGAITATTFPLIFSLAMFDGWWRPVSVIGLFLPLELVTGNFIEPRLYRQSIGVSEVALLTAAAFWAWLWGPIGLILSAPLTVVLVVLGKHVPNLEFLDVLLGDQPALDPPVMLYQRLLARDQDEAAEMVLNRAKGESAESLYDELLVPLLSTTRRDSERNLLVEADEAFIHQATHEFLEDLGERQAAEPPAENAVAVADRTVQKSRLIAFPARDEADRLALEMLCQVLDPQKWDVEVVAVATLTSELMERVGRENQLLICIGSLPPGGLAHTRYVCKRLRSRFPQLRIVVGRWGLRSNREENEAQLRDAGADYVEMTLVDARNRLNSLQNLDPVPVADPMIRPAIEQHRVPA
jgi:predicted PurR-regulated permease PerM